MTKNKRLNFGVTIDEFNFLKDKFDGSKRKLAIMN